MMLTRRNLVMTGPGLGVTLAATQSSSAAPTNTIPSLIPNAPTDQTAAFQAAIDDAAARKVALDIPAGLFRIGTLTLRPGTRLRGEGVLTTLSFIGSDRCLQAKDAANIALSDFSIDGGMRPLKAGGALVALERCADVDVRGLTITRSSANGLNVKASSGRIAACSITQVADAAIFALDSGLAISANTIHTCGNNGILVWRSKPGEDGSTVSDNQISGIRADKGGSGQNGNGVNVYRAGNVSVRANRITDCSYSAIRGNAASNIQILGNTCQRIGEVALYAEFGFEGALIANNIVDRAAAGISVTNFNEGGRLAVVQGNLIRNLVRREHEPVDKRGEGISVEADSVVSGNTIENAATVGILLGWGRHMRDCSATGNLVRNCKVGIMISADQTAGQALVANNVISGAPDGAIRAMTNWQLIGPDLATSAPTTGRVTVMGNVAG